MTSKMLRAFSLAEVGLVTLIVVYGQVKAVRTLAEGPWQQTIAHRPTRVQPMLLDRPIRP